MIELSAYQKDEITRHNLVEGLVYVDNSELREAMNKVIAYYSVPGEYLDGKYDLPDYDDPSYDDATRSGN